MDLQYTNVNPSTYTEISGIPKDNINDYTVIITYITKLGESKELKLTFNLLKVNYRLECINNNNTSVIESGVPAETNLTTDKIVCTILIDNFQQFNNSITISKWNINSTDISDRSKDIVIGGISVIVSGNGISPTITILPSQPFPIKLEFIYQIKDLDNPLKTIDSDKFIYNLKKFN
jgi:hypothetical protein